MSDAALAEDQNRRVQRGSTEDQVEQIRRQLANKDRDLTAARGENNDLRGQVATTARAASDAELGRIAERESLLVTSIEGAKQNAATAKAAMRAARDSGNLDAEMEASENFSKATVRVEALTIEKNQFDAQKPTLIESAKKRGEVVATKAPARAAEAQKWLDEHPRFETDPMYKADAIQAHNAALAAGISPNSPQYPQYLNTALGRIYGKEHGHEGGSTSQEDRHQEPDMSRSTSHAAPPNRDGEAGGGAFSTTVNGSTLRLTRDANGKPQISGQIPASWRDGARYCGMDEIPYAIDQMMILEEAKQGRNQLVTSADGGMHYSTKA